MATDTTAPAAPELLIFGEWLDNPEVTLQTSLGDVTFELYPNEAPISVSNWLAYVSTGYYDGLLFHRVIPNFVVQGGGYSTGLAYQAPTYTPIYLESDNGLSNLRGTLAMARTGAVNSATSQFYINLVNNTSLDYSSANSPGYTVFGDVISGMNVIDAIATVATTTVSGLSNVPTTEITIQQAAQTRQGVVHSDSGLLQINGKEYGAQWSYSLDAGAHWTLSSGWTLTLPEGVYEAGTLLVRQQDAAGNISASSQPGGDVIVDRHSTVIAGNSGANSLLGTVDNDPLYGLAGNDTLDGGAGDDTLNGGSGNDTINGGAGADSMIGGAGNDTYYVQQAEDKAIEVGNGGIDTVLSFLSAYTLPTNIEKGTVQTTSAGNLTGNTLANTLTGNAAANRLDGGAGNDILQGAAGADTLLGGAGNDTLTGGTGKDVLTGGTGNDVFDFNALADSGLASTTWDVITDFQVGDKIDLSTIDANTMLAGNQAFTTLITADAAFSQAGQLKLSAGVLYGNVDADAQAEFAIALTGVATLELSYLVL